MLIDDPIFFFNLKKKNPSQKDEQKSELGAQPVKVDLICSKYVCILK